MNLIEALGSNRPYKRKDWRGAWMDPAEGQKIRYSYEDVLANDWELMACVHKRPGEISSDKAGRLFSKCLDCDRCIISDPSWVLLVGD